MMSLFLLVSIVSCNEEVLILQDEYNLYNIDFFNLIFYSDENRIEACKYLNYPEYLHIIEKDETIIVNTDVEIERNNYSIIILLSLFFIFLICLSLFILVSKM